MTTTNWKELEVNHELAYFRGNLAVEFLESYTIDEMKAISYAMANSTREVEDAIRNDLNEMPPEFQNRMLNLLAKVDPDNIGDRVANVGVSPGTAPL